MKTVSDLLGHIGSKDDCEDAVVFVKNEIGSLLPLINGYYTTIIDQQTNKKIKAFVIQ